MDNPLGKDKDLLTKPEILKKAQDEFKERTGGGINGTSWQAPLCDYEPPINFRWPEYVTTDRGEEWVIPKNKKHESKITCYEPFVPIYIRYNWCDRSVCARLN